MTTVSGRNLRSWGVVLFAVALAIVAFEQPGLSQNTNVGGQDDGLTYASGQSVVPIFGGWSQNADGSFNLHFSYLNRNWREQIDLPIGPDNNIEPAPFGPDAGQPTHFLPRNNRWQFAVRVPADFGSKEVVWTLTSHGQTYRAYGILKPGYVIDEYSIQHEFGSDSTHGRKPPVVKVDGDKHRTVKAGQAVPLIAVATDENPLPQRRREAAGSRAADNDAAGGEGAPQRGRAGRAGPAVVGPGPVGGDSIRGSVTGLRFAWYVYRGAGAITFDPPMPFKVWEDQRGGSPWSPGWQPPPIPQGNRWVYNVIFPAPGTYVLRALAHNGSMFSYEDVTLTVTP
jgi:hypothetical protein